MDFSQMLSGPLAARRLADLGARVIKVEPRGGEPLRRARQVVDGVDGDALRFHSYNGGKESVELDLKAEPDRQVALRLARDADVIVQNFRQGVMERFGLGYEQLREENPGLVYASVTGFGSEGPWSNDPGQDLLGQARSGLLWLSGQDGGPPTTFGGLIADIGSANILAQVILAALVGRARTGHGAHVETSLLEACLEFQVDSLPMFLNRGEGQPHRSKVPGGGHIYVPAPYGVFRTSDGYVALGKLPDAGLAEILGHSDFLTQAALENVDTPTWEKARDRILEELAELFPEKCSAEWVVRITELKGWIVEVLDWEQLAASEGFQKLEITSSPRSDRRAVVLNAPFKIDRSRPESGPAPRRDDHGDIIRRQGWD